ncbi:hypothetical protein ACFE04_008501 [Oxalis oulophora]
MDVERSSLCNCVVNFLLEENYLLTAFELLQELLDDGRDAQAIRLKEFFADPSQFPPDQISRYNSLKDADPQSLLAEKETIQEKIAISEYELRLAEEDITRLKTELEKKNDMLQNELTYANDYMNHATQTKRKKKDTSFSDLGPLKDNERRDINCAVKEYLLMAGYRLTAITFHEEVTDQDLDVWQNNHACVSDALRHYYYQYLSSTTEAAEEKMVMLRENGLLAKSNEKLNYEKECLLKKKDMADSQISAMTKSLEGLQKDLKDKENLVQDLKQAWEHQRKELNDSRAEITALKLLIEGSCPGEALAASKADITQSQNLESYREEIKTLQMEIERLKAENMNAPHSNNFARDSIITEEKIIDLDHDKTIISHQSPTNVTTISETKNIQSMSTPIFDEKRDDNNSMVEKIFQEKLKNSLADTSTFEDTATPAKKNDQLPLVESGLPLEVKKPSETASETNVGTIKILAAALPKIVPYVLINHREELLPLMMCAIEHHPESSTRDSLTHTLFNLIKRPDEQQRRIIMDACVTLAKNVGEMRTETELLPQCWEQINHMYEERRLLVAQSCGELAEFVRPEIRDSLILSIVQQLVEDVAVIIRESAACNLALLLPLFPNMDKYFKVEELMFQLVTDPSGVVVETTLKKLLPAVINWGNKLDHVLRVLLSHSLNYVQRCPPLSGIEGSLESNLHVLGDRERWTVDVLLRMLVELLPFLHQKAIETCPFSSVSGSRGTIFSSTVLELYAGGHVEWPSFEWMHVDCFPDLIHLASLLSQKEDNLRNRLTKFLLAVSETFGDSYLSNIMLPVFLVAVGDNADLSCFPTSIHPRIKGLRPRTIVAERLAHMCVMPLLLAGVLAAHDNPEQLANYLRKHLVDGTMKESKPENSNKEFVDAIRFLCTFPEHHSMIFNILWEMVVSSNIDMKITAANLLKVIVPYIDAKVASTHVLPALVTLGTDQTLNVKYASIDAFGAVAQHFKNDMIIDKIRIQMDAFLEDGSHEAAMAVVGALVVAIFQLSALPISASDVMRRHERANALCEAIRALDATDLSANSVREFLLPSMHNLLKDHDALDPAHKEAIEIIMKERSGGTFDTIKVMGAHLGLTSLFGDTLGKRESPEAPRASQPSSPAKKVESPKAAATPSPVASEDTRFMRIMKGSFTEMLRSKPKVQSEANKNKS